MKHLLTANEIAAAVRMHPNSILRLARTGKIRCHRIGQAVRFDEDEFLEDIRRSTALLTLYREGGSK